MALLRFNAEIDQAQDRLIAATAWSGRDHAPPAWLWEIRQLDGWDFHLKDGYAWYTKGAVTHRYDIIPVGSNLVILNKDDGMHVFELRHRDDARILSDTWIGRDGKSHQHLNTLP